MAFRDLSPGDATLADHLVRLQDLQAAVPTMNVDASTAGPGGTPATLESTELHAAILAAETARWGADSAPLFALARCTGLGGSGDHDTTAVFQLRKVLESDVASRAWVYQGAFAVAGTAAPSAPGALVEANIVEVDADGAALESTALHDAINAAATARWGSDDGIPDFAVARVSDVGGGANRDTTAIFEWRPQMIANTLTDSWVYRGLSGIEAAKLSTPDTRPDGLLVSARDLEAIRTSIENSTASAQKVAQVNALVASASQPWPHASLDNVWGTITNGGSKQCLIVNDQAAGDVMLSGAYLPFEKMLAYHLTGTIALAQEARDLLMDLSASTGYDTISGTPTYDGSNECARELGDAIPAYIEAAILLEGVSVWSAADRLAFQSWLAIQVYPLVSAISNARKNNWGNGCSLTEWCIGHYLKDSGLMLNQVAPTAMTITPAQARQDGYRDQLRKISQTWPGDTQCSAGYGVQDHGGIADETRRGTTGCNAPSLAAQDASYDYQVVATVHLIRHAEAMKRLANNELYELQLPNGAYVIEQAILYVIDNPVGTSYDWPAFEMGALRAASLEYANLAMHSQIATARDVDIIEGVIMPYYRVYRGEGYGFTEGGA